MVICSKLTNNLQQCRTYKDFTVYNGVYPPLRNTEHPSACLIWSSMIGLSAERND